MVGKAGEVGRVCAMKFSPKEILSFIPFKTGIITGVLCFLIIEKPPGGELKVAWPEPDDLQKYRTEFYPLSSFPMYAEFSDAPFITFYTDDKDQPIAIDSMTRSGATAAKKDYYGILKRIFEERRVKGKGVKISDAPLTVKQDAGKQALKDFLLTRANAWSAENPDKVIRLYEGVLRLPPEGGPSVLTKTLVGEGSRNSVSATTETPPSAPAPTPSPAPASAPNPAP